MISGTVHPSIALVLAAAAWCCWRWAPAGADKVDRWILRGLGLLFTADAVVTPFARESPAMTYATVALDIVPVGFLVFGMLPGVKLSEAIPSGWRRARQIESCVLILTVLVVAIVWQHLS